MGRKPALANRILAGVFVTAVFVFLFAPVLIVVVFSFQGPPRLGPPLEDIGLHWYRRMFNNTVYMDAFRNTIVLAAISMVIALVLGTMTALGLRRAGRRLGALGNILFFMPLATPSLFVGLALLAYFDTVGVPLSHGTVAVAHFLWVFPYFLIVARSGLDRLDPQYEEVGADLGLAPLGQFRRIVLPLTFPILIGGAVLAFSLSTDEFVRTLFTIGPDSTIPIVLWGQFRRGSDPTVNALATILLVISITAAIAALGLVGARFNRHARTSGRGRKGVAG
ncbi:MAG: ABC transporter permease [Alphaproteobacteria bacterium]|nr:ABC transporter permease [Alphaproteobacteria bacterium]